MIKKTFFGILAMLALVCAGSWYFIHQNQAQAVKAEARKTYIQQAVRPSFFMVGVQAVVQKDIWLMRLKKLALLRPSSKLR